MYDSYLVGNNIRRLRVGKKLTIAQMAEDLQISESHLTQVELGTRNVSIQLLFAIINYLNTDANTVLAVDNRVLPIEYSLSQLPHERAKELKSIFHDMICLAGMLDQ